MMPVDELLVSSSTRARRRYGNALAGVPSFLKSVLDIQPNGWLLTVGAIALLVACLLGATGAVNGPFLKLNPQIAYAVFGLLGFNWLVLYVFSRPSRTELATLPPALAIGMGVCSLAIPDFWNAASSVYFYAIAPFAVPGGLAATYTIARFNRRRRIEDVSDSEVQVLGGLVGAMGFIVLFLFSGDVLLAATDVFHPHTFDARAWLIDAQFGFHPAALVAGTLSESDLLHAPVAFAYQALSMGFPVLYGVQLRTRARAPHVWNFFLVWVALTIAAMLAYHLFPIAGPRYWLGGSFFASIDPLRSATLDPVLVASAARNGMPSMHFGWALAMWVVARWIGTPWLTRFLAVLTLLMVAATLGLGEHYLIDLVVAVPFVLAVLAATMHNVSWALPARRFVAFGGLGLYLTWIVVLRWGDALLLASPVPLWLMTAATGTFGWRSLRAFDDIKEGLAQGRLHGGYPGMPLLVPGAKEQQASRTLSSHGYVLGMFFLSGLAGLIYEVLFTKQLALVFGSTAVASYSVLIAYMGGMALGAWMGGRLYARYARGLHLYFAFEVVVGLYCLAAPLLLAGLTWAYVAMAADVPPAAWWLVPMRVAFGVALLAIPTLLMGASLPVLVAHLRDRGLAHDRALARLYAVNTLGAALGAFAAGYLIIPTLGLWHTTMLAAGLNLLVGWMAWRLLKGGLSTVGKAALKGRPEAGPRIMNARPSGSRLALLVLTVVGLMTMIIETNYMHLLAVVAGTSAYAFALMLATFLLGLGAGSLAIDRFPAWRHTPSATAALLLAILALTLGLGALQWNAMADHFASYAGYPFPREFGAFELVRGTVCFLAMFPPAVCIGALYPVAVHWAVPSGDESALGRAFALNTAGNIAGVLLGGFVLLPWIGANASVKLAGLTCLLLASAAWMQSRRIGIARAIGYCAAASVSIALVLTPWQLDMSGVATGANVYFASPGWGRVIDHAESVDGGLTAVSTSDRNGKGDVLTLTTNGKFQGNNALEGEMRAQLGFAVTPLLHQPARGNALVIGYGTGVTAHTLHNAGFLSLDIADLSKHLVELADRHFADINGKISGARGVTTHIVDGRNFLLLQHRSYDLIGIELTSIWFAGAASLYNKEFYELARSRLKPQGVLQQWVQLHHMQREDVLRVIGSVRAVFPYVWVYVVGGQGMIIAGSSPAIAPRPEYADKIRGNKLLSSTLDRVGLSVDEIQSQRLLDPSAVDRLLGAMGVGREYWISTDDNSLLEYSTPKGNVLDGRESFNANMRLLTNGSAIKTPAVHSDEGSLNAR